MILRVCGLAILLAFVGYMLSELGWKGKRAFTVLGVIAMIGTVGEGLASIFGSAMSFADEAGISEVARTALKVVGVGYVFGIASDIATELGDGGVANAVSLVGRVEIMLLVLPYLEKVISLGVDMIK